MKLLPHIVVGDKMKNVYNVVTLSEAILLRVNRYGFMELLTEFVSELSVLQESSKHSVT